MRPVGKSVKVAAVFGAFLMLWPLTAAFAGDFSSTDFIARDALTNSAGGVSSSSSFSLQSSVGQSATGVSTSTSFIVRAGFLYFNDFTPESRSWRWYDDENDETPTVPLAGENVAPAGVADQNTIKLRMTIADFSSTGEQGVKFRLQYATSSSFDGATDVVEQGACTASSIWCYATGAGADGTLISTSILSDSDPCVSSVGAGCGTHNESGISTSSATQVASSSAEYEFTIKESGAVSNTVYFFRAVFVSASTSVPLETGASYPSLSTGGGTLTFSIDGLPTATSTSGVTTNVDTTSTSVPFGVLPFGTSTIAAHRLTVTTNASAGYRIFAYERQALLDQSSAEIPPVTGTNDVPDAWSTGCTSTSTGCWGYHTNASVLDGGSTRFAPDDTYAQFTGDPAEVAYSATPVTGQSTDLVYRLQVSHQQDPGDYVSQIVYIVTPVF